MERDMLIAAGVAVVLLGALLGVFMYESGSAPAVTFTYPVTWATSAGPSVATEGTLAEGEEAVIPFDITADNVTEVTVTLTWADDVGNPDRFNITVTGPNGAFSATRVGENGTLVVRFRVTPVPTQADLQAGTRDEALQRMVQDHTSRLGRGTWEAVVVLEEAPGQRPVPQAPELEVQPDGSQDYEIVFAYRTYRGQLQDAVPPA